MIGTEPKRRSLDMAYVITLDSHEYFGPFPNLFAAKDWADSKGYLSVQLVRKLPEYAMCQLRKPHPPTPETDPMTNPDAMKARMTEYSDISQALCDWFHSQGIEPKMAVTAMCYLVGIMCADVAEDHKDLDHGLTLASNLTRMIAHGAMAAK
jgi:hypothetical protein